MTQGVGRDQRHLRAHPCPVCAGGDDMPRDRGVRCSGFTSVPDARGRVWIRCTREEHAGALPADDSSPPAYRHLWGGACRCGVTHAPAPYQATGGQDIEATYDYRGEDGTLLYQVVRKVGKRFLQRRPDPGPDGWVWRLGDVRRVLYRLPELVDADRDATVYVVEGEKDALNGQAWLDRSGLPAGVWTTNAGGAGKWPSVAQLARTVLEGRSVVVIADADAPGRKHARQVADALRGAARTVTLVEPPEPHKDVSDVIAAGLGLSALVPLVELPVRAVPPPTEAPPEWLDHESPSVPDDDPRPEVRLYASPAKNVDALDAALAEHDENIFQRSGSLLQVVPTREAGKHATGTPILYELDKYSLLLRIDRYLKCVRWVPPSKDAIKLAVAGFGNDKGEWKPCQPSADMALLPMLHAKQWRQIRPIRAVTESPLFRPDGTIMQDSGYDASTGYVYRPSCEYPSIPDRPTQVDAIRALDDLRHVFCDFPYDGPASSLVPIGALLTIIARAAIDGPTPAFIFDASVRGSGKTLQGDVVHVIAFGRHAPHAAFPEKPEDQEKLLACYAVDAAAVAFFDNVKGVLGGPSLEGAITSTVVEFRVLGATVKPRLPWVSVVLVSGNNLTPTDDMVRRSLVARLEPQEENPETRTGFAHEDLLGWCMQDRPRLIASALTVLRAYACHGYPNPNLGTMQSFQSWSRLIPGAIAFAGGGNLLDARAKGQGSAADEIGALSVLLRRLPDLGSVDGLSSRQLVSAVYPAPGRNDPPDGWADVREAIEDLAPPRMGIPDSKRLGQVLARFLGRWIDGRRLVSGSSKGTRKWRSQAK